MSERTAKWTCGECGESYQASGFMAEHDVRSWRTGHKEEHRVEKLSKEEQQECWESKINAQFQAMKWRSDVMKAEKT